MAFSAYFSGSGCFVVKGIFYEWKVVVAGVIVLAVCLIAAEITYRRSKNAAKEN
jgi:hypothetical protein